MKNLIVIALVLASVSAFAAKGKKVVLTADQKACIASVKANKELKGKAKAEAKAACTKTEVAKEVAPTAPAAAPAPATK